MGYVLLAAGILLIILGLRIINAQKSNRDKNAASEPFENMFSSDLILQKLNNIENRLDSIEESIKTVGSTDAGILYEDLKSNINSDINSKIAEMIKNGFTVDEISEKFGITKGEVLLRASLKK